MLFVSTMRKAIHEFFSRRNGVFDGQIRVFTSNYVFDAHFHVPFWVNLPVNDILKFGVRHSILSITSEAHTMWQYVVNEAQNRHEIAENESDLRLRDILAL